MKFLFTLITLAVSICLAEKIRYDNYKVYRLIPNDEETFKILKQIEVGGELSNYNFFSPLVKVGDPVDLMVPPHQVDYIENLAKSRGMNASVLMENVQKYIDNEGLRPESRAGSFDWTSYHTYDEVL